MKRPALPLLLLASACAAEAPGLGPDSDKWTSDPPAEPPPLAEPARPRFVGADDLIDETLEPADDAEAQAWVDALVAYGDALHDEADALEPWLSAAEARYGEETAMGEDVGESTSSLRGRRLPTEDVGAARAPRPAALDAWDADGFAPPDPTELELTAQRCSPIRTDRAVGFDNCGSFRGGDIVRPIPIPTTPRTFVRFSAECGGIGGCVGGRAWHLGVAYRHGFDVPFRERLIWDFHLSAYRTATGFLCADVRNTTHQGRATTSELDFEVCLPPGTVTLVVVWRFVRSMWNGLVTVLRAYAMEQFALSRVAASVLARGVTGVAVAGATAAPGVPPPP